MVSNNVLYYVKLIHVTLIVLQLVLLLNFSFVCQFNTAIVLLLFEGPSALMHHSPTATLCPKHHIMCRFYFISGVAHFFKFTLFQFVDLLNL